ncbi:hypothetical protein Scep_029585 [Stephania cephalantha]|uniref:Uncharacterized protein n=1 Tax=Stephania cephalantha TaxID=152367 RepID=A0AAP0HDM2_9MAGN
MKKKTKLVRSTSAESLGRLGTIDKPYDVKWWVVEERSQGYNLKPRYIKWFFLFYMQQKNQHTREG